jgi:hypothetical protein
MQMNTDTRYTKVHADAKAYETAAEMELKRLAQPRPPLKFAFTEIGEKIVESLLKAADDQVIEAENLRASIRVLAEGIGVQLEEHAKLLGDMDARMRHFGSDVVEAHKKLLNGNGGGDAGS